MGEDPRQQLYSLSRVSSLWSVRSPPEPVAVPTNRWLLIVYGKDLMSRMDHIKASITSTFGSIFKMDSTKKVKRTFTNNTFLL